MSPRPTTRLVPRPGGIDLSPYRLPAPAPFLLDLEIPGELLHRLVDHVPNDEYVRWLDGAAEAHATAVGLSRETLLRRHVMWFVARHEIDYLAEVRGGDRLVVATWVRDMERVKSWRDYAIIRPGDQRIVCRAATLWVLVSLETRRPTRIPADVRERFAPLRAPTPGPARGRAEGGGAPCTSP